MIRAEAPGAPEPEPEPVASGSPSARADPLIGRWVGVGLQEDGQRWRFVVTIRTVADGPCAHVEYPDEPCAGEWICTKHDDNGELTAREQLTSGQDRCIDAGTMTMRVTAADALDWRWEGGGVRAMAALHREP